MLNSMGKVEAFEDVHDCHLTYVGKRAFNVGATIHTDFRLIR